MNEDCLKLTNYFGERSRTDRRLVADALLDLYGQHQVAGSILLRGAEGFGLRHRLRTDLILTLSLDLPIVAIAVDARPRIEAVLHDTLALHRPGLITLERARMLTDDVPPLTLPQELHEATKLTIYLGRQERVGGVPAFVAICDLLHRRGIAGATALLGVDGTVHGRRERARFLGRNAEVPMMIVAVGSGERMAGVLPEIGALLARPLMTLERVRICKRDGARLETPHALPSVDEHGMGVWQKLMVYSSETALHDGQPIHHALTQRLRRARASGSTTLRGIWGFHGRHAPHGDRFFQLRRRTPMVTIVIDTPEGIARSFTIVDELTQEHGLVTSEMVPALHATSEHETHGGLRLARHRF